MSISTVQNAATAVFTDAARMQQKSATANSSSSFAATLTSVSNGTKYSDADVKNFFANKPDTQQIADQAAALGLNENQIMQAMEVGGYGGSDATALKAGIESFVSASGSGYSWGAEGALVASKASINQTSISIEKPTPAEVDIKAFYATNPSEQQIVVKAKALGLTPAQMVQAEVTGQGMNMNQVSAHVLETMYVDAANKLGVDIGSQGAWKSYLSPTLGRAISPAEIQGFFATNPTDSQIFQKAADLGVGVGALTNMMNGLGISQTNTTYGSLNNKMQTSLYQGRDGFSLDQYGHVVSGGGNRWEASPDGSGSWQPLPAGVKVSATA
jgi:hypothetical protein